LDIGSAFAVSLEEPPSPEAMAFLVTALCLATLVGAGSATTAFLVMGDWGGDQHAPYTTADEVDTAAGMSTVAKQLGAKFALALGDNMYHSGVTCVNDRRFNETFEKVFTGEILSDASGFKFHLVAGNHDHIGDVNAQIQYSNVSARWVFPSLYYTFTKTTEDDATVQFVMIDTVIIAGNSQVKGENVQLTGTKLPGPTDEAEADKQIQWLEQTLSESKADYLIVAGHYPIYSICEHGPTAALQKLVKPLLSKHVASAYFAGHDHCAEHIDVGDGVQYHGIGSAAYHDKSEAHIHTIQADQLKFHDAKPGGGFASMVVSKSRMVIVHHDEDGKHLYNTTLSPRNMLSVAV